MCTVTEFCLTLPEYIYSSSKYTCVQWYCGDMFKMQWFLLFLIGLFVFPIYCLCKKKKKRPQTEMPWYEWRVVHLNGADPARLMQNNSYTAIVCWLTILISQPWQRLGPSAIFLLHCTLLKKSQNSAQTWGPRSSFFKNSQPNCLRFSSDLPSWTAYICTVNAYLLMSSWKEYIIQQHFSQLLTIILELLQKQSEWRWLLFRDWFHAGSWLKVLR